MERQRGIPLRRIYPDAFFHFQDTGVLFFSQRVQDFASNETQPVITAVGVVLTTDGTVPAQGIAALDHPGGKPEASAAADFKRVHRSGVAGSPWGFSHRW